jgi:hypothetical protein
MVLVRRIVLVSVALLDTAQVLSLLLMPSPMTPPGVVAVIPQPSFESFLHIFLGNAFWGVQELVPCYSVYALARSLYSLLPSIALLGATWHVSAQGAVVRVFSFAYSWIEVTTYSYALLQSFEFLGRLIRKRLTIRYVAATCGIVIGGILVAAALEVMATVVLWT